MKLKEFVSFVERMQAVQNRSQELYKLSIDLIEYDNTYHEVINSLLVQLYGEEGYDWVMWYFYDCDFGAKDMEARDKDGNRICYDVESLWKYLEENYSRTKQS